MHRVPVLTGNRLLLRYANPKWASYSLRYGKRGNKKRLTCLATLLLNKLNSDDARFTIKPVLQQISLIVNRFDVGGKTCNIAIQLVLQQCCKTSCTFFFSCQFFGTFNYYASTKPRLCPKRNRPLRGSHRAGQICRTKFKRLWEGLNGVNR